MNAEIRDIELAEGHNEYSASNGVKRLNTNSSHDGLQITSRQPTFPSEYASREGNASMIAILGFVIATLTAALLDVFAPDASQQTIWLYLVNFGGILQLYAAMMDFKHGNTLTACIFFLFGFHWVSRGVMMGDLAFLQNVGASGGHSPDPSVMGCYYICFTLFELMLTVCTFLNPHGSYLLFWILVVVQVKLILATIECWTPHTAIKQASGVLGILVCLMAFYSFLAESLAEHGTIIPTGKFNEVKSRNDVKKEMKEAAEKKHC